LLRNNLSGTRCKFVSLLKYWYTMKGQNRSDIKAGMEVSIVMKEDQRTGELTEGIVRDTLTKSPFHPHGIKVRLETGEVGRVKNIISEDI